MAGTGEATVGAADIVTARLAGAGGEKLVGAAITARPDNGRRGGAEQAVFSAGREKRWPMRFNVDFHRQGFSLRRFRGSSASWHTVDRKNEPIYIARGRYRNAFGCRLGWAAKETVTCAIVEKPRRGCFAL